MKEKELREKSVCAACGEKIGHAGVPLFATVTIRRWALDYGALQRQTGLEMMMGGHVALAQVMGADEDMAKELDAPVEITLCWKCYAEARTPLMAIVPEEEPEEKG